MASGQQSDMEVSGDWTLVTSVEDEKMEASHISARSEGSRVEVITEEDNDRNAIREASMPPAGIAEDDEEDAAEHGRESDVEVLDDDMDVSLQSIDSSAIAQTPTSLGFSEVSARASSYENLEVLPDDASEVTAEVRSDASIPPGLDLGPGIRRYKHVPNARLNIILSVIAALVAAAAIGLGAGHYLGWSGKFFKQKEMTQSQIGKLKQLQDELVVCMQQQKENRASSDNTDPWVCYKDGEYWKQKFETLFAENKGLRELLEQSQMDTVLKDVRVDALDEGQCEDDDFHKLKLDLILNQMQHLQLMKTFNEVRHQERQTRERARKLEEENEELKQRLVEEEEEDQLLVDLEERIKSLKDENTELRSRLKEDTSRQETLLSLESQVKLLQMENHQLQQTLGDVQRTEADPEQTVTARLSQLRDRVNQLATENEDLKAIIAKLRYGQPPPAVDSAVQDEDSRKKMSRLRRENDNLEVEIGKKRRSYVAQEEDEEARMNDDLKVLLELLKSQQTEATHWRQLYEELRNGGGGKSKVWKNISSVSWTELLGNGTVAASNALSVLLDKLRKMSLSTKVAEQISNAKESFVKLKDVISDRWDRLQQSVKSSTEGEEDRTRIVAVARAIETSLKKVYDATDKLLSVLDKSVETKASKLDSKLWKTLDALNRKLSEMAPDEASAASEDEEEVVDDVDLGKQDGGVDLESSHDAADDKGKQEKQHAGGGQGIGNDRKLWHAVPLEKREEEEEEEGEEGEEAEGGEREEVVTDWYIDRGRGRAEQRFLGEMQHDNWFLSRRRSSWRDEKSNSKQRAKGSRRKGWKAHELSSDEEDEPYFRYHGR